MNLFGKRPLALFCASFAAASVCGCYLTLQHTPVHLLLAILLFLIAALLLAVPLFLHRFHPTLLTPSLALLFAALALLQSWHGFGKKLQTVSSFDGGEVTCQILIKEEYFSKSYLSSYRAEIQQLSDTSPKAMGEVTFPFDAEWKVGDVVVGCFLVHSVNDGSENTLYRLSDGILLELEGDEEQSFSVIDRIEPDKLTDTLYDLREMLSGLIGRLIADEEGDLVSSLFLNKRELLSDQTILAFRRTGTTHLLAISGMHLSVIILLVEKLLRAFDVKKNARCVSVLMITLFYLTLTGFALSACRAFLMCCFVYLSWLFQSDNDAITSLFFSLFFILVLSPYSVCDIGMWMSVLAVLGILIAMRFLEMLREHLKKKGMSPKALHRLSNLLSPICISLAAEVFILFPMWLVFDELSLVALPCGILLSPLVTIVLFLTPFMLLFSWLPVLATPLSALLYAVCHIMLKAVSFFSSFHGITVSLGYRFFSFLIPISALIIALLLIVKLKRIWMIPVAMGLTVLSVAVFLLALRLPSSNTVRTDFLRQDENELLIFSAAEESVICDSSSGSFSPLRAAYELLHKRHTTEISAYVLTHYHTRHISTLSRLFSSFTVRTLCLPVPQTEDESSVFASLLSLAKEYGVTTLIYDRGSPLSFGPLSLTVSREVYLKRSTQPTFYITATAFDQTLLYIGESAHEDGTLYYELCQSTEQAEYVIFGWHGPTTKQDFSYPLGEGYVFLTDDSLLSYFLLQNEPKGKVICEGSHISFAMQKDDKN